MIKKEINEIKKILKKENTCINRISGCYVDANKEIKAIFDNTFYTLPEELMFKYSDIFRKTLSGTIGKNLNNLEFSIDEEMSGDKQSSLLDLVKSELKDSAVNEAFFQKIIENFVFSENYLIIIAHGTYDIPAKSTDGSEMFDSSDYVYNFMLCSICPVSLSKPGLCFDAETKTFVGHMQDWMVDMPMTGFLYPAFNDRNTDIHSLLYYSKAPEMQHLELTENVLGCFPPSTAGEQAETFTNLVEDVFGKECDFEAVKTLHENLTVMYEEKKENKETPVLEKGELKILMSQSGAKDEKLTIIDENFDTEPGRTEQLVLSNLKPSGKLEVKSDSIKIQISPDRADLLETMIVEGRECLVIPLTDEIAVNGIKIRPHITDNTDDEDQI